MLRLAMWSGPRNISTAMMRAWENRPDTQVVDEPLYAYYLTRVSVAHPGVDEVIANHDTDFGRVIRWLTEEEVPGKQVFYQKHMAHHLLPELGTEWVNRLTNCFLIREPRAMLASLEAKMGTPVIRDTGLLEQVAIFRMMRDRTRTTPPVLDAADVLRDPRRILGALCESVGIPFSDRMLRWPAGPRDTDGVWAKYWYEAVNRSTGFEPYQEKDVALPAGLEGLYEECRGYYEELYRERLR